MATEEQISKLRAPALGEGGPAGGRGHGIRHAAEVELNAESESPDAPTETAQPNKNSLPG